MRVFMQFLYTQKERAFMNRVTNCFIKGSWSGRQDLNLRPLHPQSRFRTLHLIVSKGDSAK